MPQPGYKCGHYSDVHNPHPDTAIPSLCEACIRRKLNAELFKISAKYTSRIEHADRDCRDHMDQDEELNKKLRSLREDMAREQEEARRWYADMERDRRALVRAMC